MQRKIKSIIKDVSRRSIHYCLDFYLEDYAIDAGLKSMDSLFYRSLHLYEFFKGFDIKDLSEMDIIRYNRWRRKTSKQKRGKVCANNSLTAELTLLRAALNKATEYGILKNKNDVKIIKNLKIKTPKLESRTSEYIPSIEEAELIMSYLPLHLYKLAFCAHRLGYRKSELISLKFGNISFQEHEIRLSKSKNKKGRNTPLYPEIEKFLKDMHSEAQEIFGRSNVNDKSIFRDKDGVTPLNIRNVRYWWCKAIKEARTPDYHFHDLRKSAIKYLKHVKNFSRDMIKEVYTGHRSWDIFNGIYDSVTSEDYKHWKKKAIAS